MLTSYIPPKSRFPSNPALPPPPDTFTAVKLPEASIDANTVPSLSCHSCRLEDWLTAPLTIKPIVEALVWMVLPPAIFTYWVWVSATMPFSMFAKRAFTVV